MFKAVKAALISSEPLNWNLLTLIDVALANVVPLDVVILASPVCNVCVWFSLKVKLNYTCTEI